MGANGPKRQLFCHRNHPLIGANARTKGVGMGRRCVACGRAISHLHNEKTRKGIEFDESDVQRVSDYKLREILPNYKSALTTG